MGLLKKAEIANRRWGERKPVLWGSRIFSADGSRNINCITLDISPAGARVALDEQQVVSGLVFFMDMRNRLAYEARVVWTKAPELGLEFLKVQRFHEVAAPGLRRAIQSERG